MYKRQTLLELTAMGGISIILVMLIHAFGSTMSGVYSVASYAHTPWLFRLLSCCISMAVPSFIFCSGYKFAHNDWATAYPKFLKKRLPRVVMSFLIINTFYWLLDSILYYDLSNVVLLAKTYITSWLGNTVAYPLWYIPMYCFVVIACPLLKQVITDDKSRFLLWLGVALTQKLLAAWLPVWAERPIMFLAYPVFFEMGIMAQRMNWQKRRIPAGIIIPVILGGVIVVFVKHSIVYDLTKYVCFCLLGVPLLYELAKALRGSKLLRLVGEYSYPIFLFHEPLIGGLIRAVLSHTGVDSPVLYCLLWTLFTSAITALLIFFGKNTRIYKLICHFSLK